MFILLGNLSIVLLKEQDVLTKVTVLISLPKWLPRWLNGKESTCQAGDVGLTPGLGRSPGEGNDNPLQYSCLESLMDSGAWQAI